MLRRYTAIDASNPRARAVRAFPWGDVPGQGARFNARWSTLRAFVAAFDGGAVADPCPNAEHWGGRGIDPPRGRMVPARCSAATANTFYAVRR
jgi:hypothetical protein